MIKTMLWIVASILFVRSLALYIFLLWEKLPPIQAGSLALGDLMNLLMGLLTMIGLAIALVSHYFAIAADQKSIKDDKERLKNLDASQAQLWAAVADAIKQQKIFSKNLDTSQAQLILLGEQWERELELTSPSC
jgi:hypothetical protein